jgi:hypothetical protein
MTTPPESLFERITSSIHCDLLIKKEFEQINIICTEHEQRLREVEAERDELLSLSPFSPPSKGWPDFGDYVLIEQKRFGAPNEMYLHKVIQRSTSNAWIDVPAQIHFGATIHDEMADVIRVVCCGPMEENVLQYRVADVKPLTTPQPEKKPCEQENQR